MAGGRGPRTPRIAAAVVAWFSVSDLNPLTWLGNAASEAAGETWTSAMVASWSAGMWILQLAFRAIDAFVTPDLTASGPMGAIYPFTFGLGLVMAVVMSFVQIGVAAFRRDGASVARLLIGVAQFAAIWVGYVGVASMLVAAASGLTHGLLESLLGVDSFAGYKPGSGWPRDVNDTVTATVLGLCSWLLIWPAAIAYLLVMLVREAALLLLAATSPIAAGGLISDLSRSWFWKSLRWFLASILVAPLAALVLGVGQKITEGVVSGAGEDTLAAVSMAVVGSILVLVAAISPLVLFRLLAFVDPGTSNGAAMRTSLAAQGGLSGLLSRQSGGQGDAATQDDGVGRSSGEASADAVTSSRFAAASSGVLGSLGGLATGAASFAQSAVAVSSDILSSSGVGHQHPYFGSAGAPGGGGSATPTPATADRPTQPDPPAPGGPDGPGVTMPPVSGPTGPAGPHLAGPPGAGTGAGAGTSAGATAGDGTTAAAAAAL